MRRPTAAAVVALVLLAACGGDGSSAAPERDPDGDSATTEPTGPAEPAGPTAAELCNDLSGPEPDAARVASDDLVEISGLALSRQQDGVLWAHNDSGGSPEVFALAEDGSHLGSFTVPGAEAVDWEDMTIGGGPASGTDYLYLGDIGNNSGSSRPDDPIRIYRVPEPGAAAAGAEGESTTEPATVIGIAYPDGPRDAETLMADPTTGDLYVVSKQWDGAPAGVYRLPAEAARAEEPPAEPVTLERVADVPGTGGVWVTGGDVSANGALVALRTYEDVWLFDRAPDQSVAEALARGATCRMPVEEPQGEAVAFTAEGDGFVTVSEGEHQPLNRQRQP